MKLYIMTEENNNVGGGNTFQRNFKKGLKSLGIPYQHCHGGFDWDVAFCPGATMTTRYYWELGQMKRKLGKKIILRVDGVPEDWRNRGTGWSRLRDYAKQSDLVIYQSDHIASTVGRLLGVKGPVIYNGCDRSVFRPSGVKLPRFGSPSVLYVNFRKGENNKRVEEAIERFRYYKLDNKDATMTFVGNFSKKQFLWNSQHWDFGMLDMESKKDWQYLGIIKEREKLAEVMRSCDYIAFPSFADPCPNTLIEAMSCGCKPLWINDYGGQKEIVDNFDTYDWSLRSMASRYVEEIEKIL